MYVKIENEITSGKNKGSYLIKGDLFDTGSSFAYSK
jgi:hypothetical protein